MNRRRPVAITPSEIVTILVCAGVITAAFFYRSLSFVHFVIALALAGVLRSLVASPIRGFAKFMTVLVFITLGVFAVSASVREDAAKTSSRARADSARAYSDSLMRWQLTTIIWNQAGQKTAGQSASRVKGLADHAEGGTLRRRVLTLSMEIYYFLLARQTGEPPASADPDQAVHRAPDQIAYMDQTADIFSRKFGDRVRRAIRDLQELGQKDPSLERLVEKPVNPAACCEIADRLTALGQKVWK